MPFRERVKRVFRSSTSSSDTSSLKKDDSRKSSIFYQPGEKMPPLKYRRPVAPEHKEKLESFSFGTSWRRKSHQSQYSPMGSRLSSRAASRANSVVGPHSGRNYQRGGGGVGQVVEGVDDDTDPTNVGLSRQPTHEDAAPGRGMAGRHARKSAESHRSPPRTIGGAGAVQNDTPWTQEDLALALKKSHLAVPA